MRKNFYSFQVTGYLYERYTGDKEDVKTHFERKINVVAPSATCAQEVIRANYQASNKNILGCEAEEIIESITLIDEQFVSYVVTVT